MQISATLVKGKARIAFTQTKVSCPSLPHSLAAHNTFFTIQGESYTLSKAQHAYKSLVKIHEKSGKPLYCLLALSSIPPPPPPPPPPTQAGSHLPRKRANSCAASHIVNINSLLISSQIKVFVFFF